MLRTRLQKKYLTSKELGLENKGFARGTSYVGMKDRRISFFFVKPTVHCRYLEGGCVATQKNKGFHI
jgi:hypothetical protein